MSELADHVDFVCPILTGSGADSLVMHVCVGFADAFLFCSSDRASFQGAPPFGAIGSSNYIVIIVQGFLCVVQFRSTR